MSDAITAWIKERRETHAAATKGPWELGHGGLDFSGRPDSIVCGDGDDPIIYPQDERGGSSWDRDADATAIVDAHNTLPRALDALSAVLELHGWRGYTDGNGDTIREACNECDLDWPCPTVEAIERAISDE